MSDEDNNSDILKKEVQVKKVKVKRQYEVWPGSNRFLFGGLCVTGPDKRYFFIALAFITLPALFFCGLIWPVLFWKLEPYVSVPLAVMYFLVLFCMYGFMFLTRYRDPGIVPRSPPLEYDAENPWDYELKKPAEFRKVNLYGDTKFRVKFCETCNVYRPPRCTHCAVCNNCVERFDHHCPWVGNCIGRRNYQTFIAFVWSVILGTVYIAMMCVAYFVLIILEGIRIRGSGVGVFLYILGYGIWPVLLFVYCVVAIGFVGFLGSFHCSLLFKNQTTNEKLKGLYNKKPNPFSYGPLVNYLRILFPPMYPSYHELRAIANEEETRYSRRAEWPRDKKQQQKYMARKVQESRKLSSSNNSNLDNASPGTKKRAFSLSDALRQGPDGLGSSSSDESEDDNTQRKRNTNNDTITLTHNNNNTNTNTNDQSYDIEQGLGEPDVSTLTTTPKKRAKSKIKTAKKKKKKSTLTKAAAHGISITATASAGGAEAAIGVEGSHSNTGSYYAVGSSSDVPTDTTS
eukprot:TRINITY_DN6149_c2_g1_i1.p1 TRINITY_DN6149_c2_g1~~TRINITY_DN6149_c2_g1_i1.p1  ORF type:complete len:514 (-),score=90.52 TRINITY_DN6149_c2_g1_i1:89-1630(-)